MARLSRSFGFTLALVFGLASSGLAQSQATTGVIEGTVVDETSAAVPGATVTIRNTATNFERALTTDADGRFRGLLLPLGPYRVAVSKAGFSTLVREGINLSVGQTVSLTLGLKVSAVQEEVVVNADAGVIETARAEGATKIDSASIEGLPNNGRNFLDFTKLTPGVTIYQGPDGDEISINGQKGINNNISVDGADFNNPFFGEQRGGQRPAFTFNLDAVKEVVVVAEGANAEFGRANSGFINVVTKSGTNDIHGTVHAYFRDDSFSSKPKNKDGSDAEKLPFSQQQLGFTLGGPLKKDKVFYFLAFDYQNGSSTKQTNSSRIEPRVVDYFARLGIPNENGPIDRTNDARVFLAKVDWQASAQHLLTLRYNYTWSEQQNGTFDVDSWGVSANALEKDYSHSVSGSVISSLSSNVLNEFRFQWAREYRPRPYQGPTLSGGRPLPDTAFDFGKTYRFGMPFFIPVDYYDQRIQFNENISLIKGRHSIKAGVEFNKVKSVQTFRGFQNGRWIFDSVDGFFDYVNNPVTGASHLLLFRQDVGVGGISAEAGGTQSIPQTEPAVFIQDKWQPNRKLTIQYGLRWEAQIEPDPITPPGEVFYAGFFGKTVTNSVGTHTFPSDGTIPSDYQMWQPRLGISWDPKGDGKTVVRVNGGIFYARVPGLNTASSRSTNGSILKAVGTNNGLAYPNLLPQAPPGIPDHPDIYVFDKNFQNPRTYSGSIGIEREVVKDLALLVQYNHAKGVHILRWVDRNELGLGGPWATGLGPDGRNGIHVGFPGIPEGLMTAESSAKSLYRGLTIGLTKKLSHNFQAQANYTRSKDMSDDDNERDPFNIKYAKVTDFSADYGLSERDQKHRFNGWLLWDAPGQLNVNLRYSYRSAQPKSLKRDGTPANSPGDRVNSDGTVTQRNLGRKDNQYSSLDLRVSREFKVQKKVSIEPIVEVFNLTGSKNFREPQYGNLVFNFDGTIAAGLGDPRQAQLGVRLIW